MSMDNGTQSVQDILNKKGINTKVINFPASTRTAEDAAKTIGCQVAQVVKSLVFRTKNTKRPILILVSGINRVNEKVLTKAIGEEIVKADADFVREVTGFAIGGVPPVGHKQKIDTFIDEDLLKLEELWAAAGTPYVSFKLDSKDLINLTNGKVLSVK